MRITAIRRQGITEFLTDALTAQRAVTEGERIDRASSDTGGEAVHAGRPEGVERGCCPAVDRVEPEGPHRQPGLLMATVLEDTDRWEREPEVAHPDEVQELVDVNWRTGFEFGGAR